MSWEQGHTLQYVEDQAILAALQYFDGNRSKVAADLGVTYRTIARKIASLRARGYEVAPAKKAKKAQ